MSLKQKIAAATLSLTTLFGPTVNIHNNPVENKAEYRTEISISENKAMAGTRDLEGRLAVLGFDVLFNGLKSGIGAYSKGKDFWPAFGKGALSGVVVYGGKEIAAHNKYPFLGASGKLVHDFGVSMSDNVMRGKPMLSRYVTDIGPVELHFEDGKLDSMYLLPVSAFSIIDSIANGRDFDVKQSLYNLTPVFSYKIPKARQHGELMMGYAGHNVINYCRNCEKRVVNTALSHEMNHVLFYSEFRFLDDLIGKKSEAVENMILLHPFAEAFDHVRLGGLIAKGIFALPKIFSKKAYWYVPQELEAYTMQMPRKENSHPFYR